MPIASILSPGNILPSTPIITPIAPTSNASGGNNTSFLAGLQNDINAIDKSVQDGSILGPIGTAVAGAASAAGTVAGSGSISSQVHDAIDKALSPITKRVNKAENSAMSTAQDIGIYAAIIIVIIAAIIVLISPSGKTVIASGKLAAEAAG
jgi:hypothetical protein